MNEFQQLPSVDRLLNDSQLQQLVEQYGHTRVVRAVRGELEKVRAQLRDGNGGADIQTILDRVILRATDEPDSSPRRVINASGVILHTNLGRAPLAQAALDAISKAASGYSNLEYDLEKGARGSRSTHAVDLLREVSGAEDALVVNNNAGAVLLCLSALAARKKVIISRSQLVEIGGGFRIPDVMRQSRAHLVEVGTTNRTRLSDYRSPLEEGAALVLRAHSSNFKILGFTEIPALEEIVDLAHQFEVPFMDDLGSGALLDTSLYGLAHEPQVQESIRAGADLVCFSGDKLLGGPQAGIIVGRSTLLEKIKRHPLARALRADKLCLAGLTATLQIYLDGQAEQKIPVWKMISAKPERLKERVAHWVDELGQGEVIPTRSTVGGGSLPGEDMPTFALGLQLRGLSSFLSALRHARIPVIARVEKDHVLFDPRTVLEQEDQELIQIIKETLNEE
jgi:L-seryl-tRNA(Ser) seleniumtransferase